MPYCPITYETLLNKEKYSQKGLKKLSKTLKDLNSIPFTQEELRQEARNQVEKISIQGMQPKMSARLNISKQCFELVNSQGTFILKPQTLDYIEMPENEDLSMRLAQASGINTPLHGLIYSKDSQLVYFIKRFDRVKNKKLAVEDFSQLTGMSRDTKYNYSMEKLITIIDIYTTFPKIEKAELFLRVLVNFLIGNEDMHLKNYSLITYGDKITLAPAYDFVNSTLALKAAKEEIALPLNGKKRNLQKKDLIHYFGIEKLGLSSKIIEQKIQQIIRCQPKWSELIGRSFLSAISKEKYSNLIKERIERLHFFEQ